MEITGFIVLERDLDGFQVNPFSACQEEITLGSNEGCWKYCDDEDGAMQIGTLRTSLIDNNPVGIIGVFNPQVIEHLNTMVGAIQERENLFASGLTMFNNRTSCQV